MTEKDEKKFFSAKDLAELFDKSKPTIQYQLNNSKVKPAKIDGNTRLYDYNTYEMLASKYLDAGKHQKKLNAEITAKADPQLAMQIKAKLDLIIRKLDVDTANGVMSHIDDLVHDTEMQAVNEYLTPFTDQLSKQTDLINSLAEKVDLQTEMIRAQTKMIKAQTETINLLRDDVKHAKKKFSHMSWVDTKKLVAESWAKLSDEQRKEFYAVLPIPPKKAKENRGLGEVKLP